MEEKNEPYYSALHTVSTGNNSNHLRSSYQQKSPQPHRAGNRINNHPQKALVIPPKPFSCKYLSSY